MHLLVRYASVGCLLVVQAGCSLLPDKGELLDADGDGFTFDEDCDDGNPAINPDA